MPANGAGWRAVLGKLAPFLLGAGLLAALAIPYFRALSAPAVGLFHDDGVYAITARSVAEGNGYRLTNLPESPRQTKYPPAFPFLLAGVWRLFPGFPQNLVWLKAVPFVFSAGWLALSFLLLRILRLPAAVVAAVCFAVAVSPFTIYLSTALLSETMFAALVTAALVVLERAGHRGDVTVREVVFAAALAAGATLTRAVGVSALLAIAGWLAWRRDWRNLFVFGAVAGGFLLPWAWWVLQHGGEGYYTIANYTSWHVFSTEVVPTLGHKAHVLLHNALMFFFTPVHFWSLQPLAGLLVIVPGIALFTAGLARALGRNSVTAWFALAYSALVLCWLWPPLRFVVVAMPVFLWVALQALPAPWLAKRSRAVALALLLVAVPASIDSWQRAEASASTGIFAWLPDSGETWKELTDTALWIRENSTEDTILIGNLDPLWHLFTGRKAVRGFAIDPYRLFYQESETPEALTAYFAIPIPEYASSPVLVIRSPDKAFSERSLLHQAINREQQRGALKEVFRAGGVTVFRPVR